MNNFERCITEVLKSEGGYSNNPKDPGGPTKYGITLIDYKSYIDVNGTAKDVKNLTIDQAKSIYRSKYWHALDCENLPSGVDYTVFDYGVNSGLGRPRKALQRFKNKSGIELIDAINNERMTFLRSLPTYSTFGKGWSTRVEHVRSVSKEMFNKKDNLTGPAIGLAAAGGGYSLLQYWHRNEVLIVLCAIGLSVLVGAAFHYYRNKGK